jgi:hypothetical protein
MTADQSHGELPLVRDPHLVREDELPNRRIRLLRQEARLHHHAHAVGRRDRSQLGLGLRREHHQLTAYRDPGNRAGRRQIHNRGGLAGGGLEPVDERSNSAQGKGFRTMAGEAPKTARAGGVPRRGLGEPLRLFVLRILEPQAIRSRTEARRSAAASIFAGES